MVGIGRREGREIEALALVALRTGCKRVREGGIDRVRRTEGSPAVHGCIRLVIAQGRLEGGKVREAAAVPRLGKQLSRVQSEDDDDGKDGDDRDHDEELDEGEGILMGSFCPCPKLVSMGRRDEGEACGEAGTGTVVHGGIITFLEYFFFTVPVHGFAGINAGENKTSILQKNPPPHGG